MHFFSFFFCWVYCIYSTLSIYIFTRGSPVFHLTIKSRIESLSNDKITSENKFFVKVQQKNTYNHHTNGVDFVVDSSLKNAQLLRLVNTDDIPFQSDNEYQEQTVPVNVFWAKKKKKRIHFWCYDHFLIWTYILTHLIYTIHNHCRPWIKLNGQKFYILVYATSNVSNKHYHSLAKQCIC